QTFSCPHHSRHSADRDWPALQRSSLADSGRPQAFRFDQVEAPLRVYDDCVVAPCLVGSNQPVEHIIENRLGIACAWIAETTATRQREADCIAGRHGLAPLRTNWLARAKSYPTLCARCAMFPAPRRIVHSLKITKECNWSIAGSAKLNDLAKP